MTDEEKVAFTQMLIAARWPDFEEGLSEYTLAEEAWNAGKAYALANLDPTRDARLRREAREAMREDAAKVAEAAIANEGFGDPWDSGWDAACEENASAIRALSTDAQGEGVK